MSHSIKEWTNVTRYWSLPISLTPVIITFSYLWSRGVMELNTDTAINLILILLCVTFIHFASNVTVDLFDFRNGVDRADSFKSPYLVHHKFYPEEYRDFAILLFFLGVAVGAVLSFRTGPTMLFIGSIGLVLAAALPIFKYNALGNLCILLIVSSLSVMGTTCALCGKLFWDALIVALPLEILIFAALHANNILNTGNDKRANIHTSAMLMGGKVSVIVYIACMILPFAGIAACVLSGILHWSALLCFTALVPAVKSIIKACSFKTRGVTNAMADLDSAAGRTMLIFGLTMSVSLFVAGFLI